MIASYRYLHLCTSFAWSDRTVLYTIDLYPKAKLLGDEFGYGSPLLGRSPSRRRSGRHRSKSPWRGAQYSKGADSGRTDGGEMSRRASRTRVSGRTRTERSGSSSPDYTVNCLGKRSRSPSPTGFSIRTVPVTTGRRAAEYYGTTQLAQRSRSPSPTASHGLLPSSVRMRCVAGATTSSAAAAALATASAAGGLFGSLMSRRLPVTPPVAAAAAATAGPGDAIFGSLFGSAALASSGVAAALLHSDLPQPISPTLVDPSLATISGPASPPARRLQTTAAVGKGLARALRVQLPPLETNLMNFPSVSLSPTIPNGSNRSPNGINFPKLNASPTRRAAEASLQQADTLINESMQPMQRLQTPVDMRSEELQQLLVDQSALLVDEDDLHELGVFLPPTVSKDTTCSSAPMETSYNAPSSLNIPSVNTGIGLPMSNQMSNTLPFPIGPGMSAQQMTQTISGSLASGPYDPNLNRKPMLPPRIQPSMIAPTNHEMLGAAPPRELPQPPNFGYDPLGAIPFNRIGPQRDFHCTAPIKTNQDWR